jgi:hypothetical protein
MSQTPAKTNVIQFPGAKKEGQGTAINGAPVHTPPPAPPVLPKGKSQLILGACILAVAMISAAVNQKVFNSSESADLASLSAQQLRPGVRSIASVGTRSWNRDADWEKRLAENLAQMPARDLASAQIGHAATVEEKLRWGILEEKYTIVYRPEMHTIDSILLQDPSEAPAYILDRMKFLKDFGPLLDNGVESARLDSVISDAGKTVEAYTLFDKDQRPTASAHFELDRYHRLLSLKVEQI